MNDFINIFQSVNGFKVLIQYLKSHVLGFALLETLLLGRSKKSLEIVRLAVNNKIYQRLNKSNKKFVENFKLRNKQPKFTHEHKKTIWTIWLQGMDNAPEVVKNCYRSMEKNISGYDIKVITDDNYSEYVTFPGFIIEKYDTGIISKVHFADLLRIELLVNYGGTWLDGTVFCSKFDFVRHSYFLESDLFLFQNLKPGLDGHCNSISSWLITSISHHKILMLVQALLHRYWNTHNYAVDYFILHNFFQIAIESYPDDWNKVIPISNSMPHILQLRLFEQYDDVVWKCISDITPFHKLTYKFEEEKSKLKDTYYDIIVKGKE